MALADWLQVGLSALQLGTENFTLTETANSLTLDGPSLLIISLLTVILVLNILLCGTMRKINRMHRTELLNQAILQSSESISISSDTSDTVTEDVVPPRIQPKQGSIPRGGGKGPGRRGPSGHAFLSQASNRKCHSH